MSRSERGQAEVPLPWERLLWSGRPAWPFSTEQYFLTDFRVVRQALARVDELVLHDIGEVICRRSRLDALLGTSTIVVRPRDARRPLLLLRGVRRGPQLAALLELVSGEPPGSFDTPGVDAALAWNPQQPRLRLGEAASAVAVVLIGLFAVVAGLHGTEPVVTYAPDDPIYPSGHKRDRAEIVRFMREDIMPWARTALGPIVHGPDSVTCETCHGRKPAERDWRMPAVAALPQPDLREKGWERYGGTMDAQMRNAIYGYLAEPDKQPKAAYMREVVMPGMARLLRRPAYDFTQTYAFNRARLAFGCYHCHLVH
jgi:hypothetical protein